ncbi:MAG: hypothetical protein AseanaTS_03700 [Candidatus Pelagadaptatus aseana]|uniref:hypothetical protein n=1 Tax=Candidatus Pelagadaptatus aseana TaxID=3120508 RepID=UPI0039B355CD
MNKIIGITLLILSQISFADDAGQPLERASKAYLAGGAEAFIPALLKGSPLEGEKSVLTQSNTIRQIEAYYGAYQGFEVMYEKPLTNKVRLVYYVMNYEHSPLFGVATYYKRNNEEVVTNFNFHTELWQIVPNDVIFK